METGHDITLVDGLLDRATTTASEPDLIKLLYEAIKAAGELTAAFEQERGVGNIPEPPQPKMVENISDWSAYKHTCRTIRSNKETAHQIRMGAEAWAGRVQQAWMKFLPTEVWFRSDDVGVGLSFSNWGGSSYSIEVAPWQDKMPSLDKRYHGD